jgi:hypothetical protein
MDRADNRLLPVPTSGPLPGQGARRTAQARAERTPPTDPAYVAQLYGQSGQKRGLRGGAPVLEAARAAYLEAEYSGENDRRPPRGIILKKAI